MLRLGLPVMVTQLGIIIVTFADTMMVGAYGTEELAAAAFVNSLFMVPVVMQIGFANGMTPLIGALFSRGEAHTAGRTLRAGLQVNMMVSAFFMALMGVLYFFLDRFGQPEELLPLIRPYYLVILFSLFPMAVFCCCQQTANGTTDTATPMWIILASNVINIFGNWLLITGNWGCPELGLTGAGLSTLAARLLGPVAILTVFRLWRRYRPYWQGLCDASGGLGRVRLTVWRTSYPVAIQSGIECALWSLGAVVSGWFGKIQLASYQVVNTIAQLGFMVYMSFGVAGSIKVANFTGARDLHGLRRTANACLHLNLLLGTVASLVFVLWARPLIHFFTPDAEVVGAAVALIVPLLVYQYGDAVQITYANTLRGTGDVQPLLWVALTAYIIVGAPLLLALAVGLDMGNVGVYWSFTGALGTASVMLLYFFNRAWRRLEREWDTTH